MQTKLEVSEPGDRDEQEAERAAERVMRMPDPTLRVQRRCACGGIAGPDGECAACRLKRLAMQRQAASQGVPSRVPAGVHRVLQSPGGPLDGATRGFMESRMARDFGGVRIHTDSQAAESARSLRAIAYTVGANIVFAAGRYQPGTAAGRHLLAHELAHTIQQGAAGPRLHGKWESTRPGDTAEAEATKVADIAMKGGSTGRISRQPLGIARQAEAAPGTSEQENESPRDAGLPGGVETPPAGAMGQAGEDATGAATTAYPGSGTTMICSKSLEAPVAGWFANHSYIDDTGRGDCKGSGLVGNYAVTDLISGNFVRGCAVKTDRSPDPRGKTPNMKPCRPKAGVTDLSKCLRDAYDSYADPSIYSNVAVTVGAAGGAVVGGIRGARTGARIGGIFGTAGAIVGGIIGGLVGAFSGALRGARLLSRWNGPNSNTFAATLAKACCADSSDSGLGWVPGWQHAPATPCTGGGGGTADQGGEGSEQGSDGAGAAEPQGEDAGGAGGGGGASGAGGGGGTPATPTTPRPYSGPVAGQFVFGYVSGLPSSPIVGQVYMVTISFESQGNVYYTTLEFQVMRITATHVELESTNTSPIDVAPPGHQPLVIGPRNPARLPLSRLAGQGSSAGSGPSTSSAGGRDTAPTDLHAFGNTTKPRDPRRGIDIQPDADDNVGPTNPPTGASTFGDVNKAPLTGHYHRITSGTSMTAGLKVIADGSEVGGPHRETHHTIYPAQKMKFQEFVDKFQALPWTYAGKK